MLRLLAAMALGALLLAIVYQIPVSHSIDVGGYDAAYSQGFFDPERNRPDQRRPELEGSDGSARWTGASSFLVLPQAGLPAQISLHLRGWRNTGAPPEVTVLLNGTRELGRFRAGAEWQEHSLAIDGGLLKPNDLVIEIRSDTAQLDRDDPRHVGVLLDRATYRVGPAPIVPYPPQLLYGALAAGMLYTLLVLQRDDRPGDKQTRSAGSRLLVYLSPGLLTWFASVLALSVAFLLLYRVQPLYPYPLLRLLPALDGLLAALLALRYGPALARRAPALLDLLAVSGLGAWLAAVLVAAQRHVTLSVPSVEKDFHVFALRSARLAGTFQPSGSYPAEIDGVFRADGFYNLGYPLLLWLARRLTNDNPFLAARLLAALSGALLLGAGWWLARRLLGRGPALLALIMLALSPLVIEYSLYIGTDMPFAAACTLALALLLPRGAGQAEHGPGEPAAAQLQSTTPPWPIFAAGLVAGAAFLIRHPGVLLLPFGCLSIWLNGSYSLRNEKGSRWDTFKSSIGNARAPILLFVLAFALAIVPQLYVNLRDAGQPFYSQQAKNIWQAVYGNGDWGRWGEANNTIGIGAVIAQDPQRFLTNWSINLRGFVGSGGEDTREFGQAVQLRLLGFPANWLAVAGLLGWLASTVKRQKGKGNSSVTDSVYSLPFTQLLIWIALYVVAISAGLALQARFLLPLAPIYALAAAWSIVRVARLAAGGGVANGVFRAPLLLAGLLLLVLLGGGFAIGAEYVLRQRAANEPALARAQGRAENPGQPAAEATIVERALARLQPGERLVVRAEAGVPIGKYSPIAHLVVPAPASDEPAALRATGARYLIWSGALGPAPKVGQRLDAAGIYELYRIE